MSHRRRSTLITLALCLLLSTATVGQNAPPPNQVPDTPVAAADSPVLPVEMTAMLEAVAADARVTIHPDGSGSVPAATVEVIVAKIGPDGKVITACVNDSQAAKRFFAPVPKQRAIAAPAGTEEK